MFRILGRPLAVLLAPAVALALAAPLAAPVTATAAPAGPDRYRAGLSAPVEDSYYPAKGDPGVDVLHYGLRLRWMPASRTLAGNARLTLRATSDDDGFRLDLSGRLRVRSVLVDGAPADFRHRGKHLIVDVPTVADERYTVRVRYRGEPGPVKAPTTRQDLNKVGWHTTRSGQVWTLQEPFGAYTWYPSNDQPSDKALYDIRVNVPGRWVGVSNGQLLSRRRAEGRTITRWRMSHPAASYLVTLAIGPYRHYTQTGPHGLPLNYWVPRGRPELVRPLMRTPAALRWLERRLGPYPFDSAGVVVIPAQSAMETQTLVTFGAREYRWGARSVRETIVHELAHQWYGDTVTPTDWRDLWMNEGMAMYLQARWSVDQGYTRWRHWRRTFLGDDALWRDVYGPPGDYNRWQWGSINVYYCTAAMWETLREKLGTRRFNRLIRQWPQQHLDSSQDRGSFIDWIEAETGRELSGFFRRWLMSERSPTRRTGS